MYDMREVVIGYEILTGKIKQDLDEQLKTNKIKGTEYADVYNKLMAEAMRLSFESPVKAAQTQEIESRSELIDAQIKDQEYVTNNIRPKESVKLSCEIDLCQAQTDLVEAQTDDQKYITQNLRPTESLIKQEELDIARTKNSIETQNLAIKEKEVEIKEQEVEIAKEKLELSKVDVDYRTAQKEFTIRQTQGFDDNKKQKMLDIQMNAWAMMFSSGLLEKVPQTINSCVVDSLLQDMYTEIGVPFSGNCAS